MDPQLTTPDHLWNQTKEIIQQAASLSGQPRQNRKRQHWMSDETLTLVGERRQIKDSGADLKLINEKSARIQEACRRDQNNHLRNLCAEAEVHANKQEARD